MTKIAKGDSGSRSRSKINDAITVLEMIGSIIYPVGSIYFSINNTNPSTLFGGTWVAFGTGRTVVGVDTGQAEFNEVEKTGGNKTHQLSIDEMPSHTHIQDEHTHTQQPHSHSYTQPNAPNNNRLAGLLSSVDGTSSVATGDTTAINNNTTATNQNTGGGQAHNNLQPYITVYMFKRTE